MNGDTCTYDPSYTTKNASITFLTLNVWCCEPLYFSGPSRGWGSGMGSYTLQSFPV